MSEFDIVRMTPRKFAIKKDDKVISKTLTHDDLRSLERISQIMYDTELNDGWLFDKTNDFNVLGHDSVYDLYYINDCVAKDLSRDDLNHLSSRSDQEMFASYIELYPEDFEGAYTGDNRIIYDLMITSDFNNFLNTYSDIDYLNKESLGKRSYDRMVTKLTNSKANLRNINSEYHVAFMLTGVCDELKPDDVKTFLDRTGVDSETKEYIQTMKTASDEFNDLISNVGNTAEEPHKESAYMNNILYNIDKSGFDVNDFKYIFTNGYSKDNKSDMFYCSDMMKTISAGIDEYNNRKSQFAFSADYLQTKYGIDESRAKALSDVAFIKHLHYDADVESTIKSRINRGGESSLEVDDMVDDRVKGVTD